MAVNSPSPQDERFTGQCELNGLSTAEAKQEEKAAFERSDITVVPAAGVIGEAMVALTLAAAVREKFGGDSLGEMKWNFEGYREQLREY